MHIKRVNKEYFFLLFLDYIFFIINQMKMKISLFDNDDDDLMKGNNK
jgi:hypothetical protein